MTETVDFRLEQVPFPDAHLTNVVSPRTPRPPPKIALHPPRNKTNNQKALRTRALPATSHGPQIGLPALHSLRTEPRVFAREARATDKEYGSVAEG
jgi:hypothetical protein